MRRMFMALIAAFAVFALPGIGAAAPPADGMLLAQLPGMPADAATEPVPQGTLVNAYPLLQPMIQDGTVKVAGRSWFHASVGAAAQMGFTSDSDEFTRGFIQGRQESLGAAKMVPAGDGKAYLWTGVKEGGDTVDELIIVRGNAIVQFGFLQSGFLTEDRATELIAAEIPLMPTTQSQGDPAFELGVALGRLIVWILLLVGLPIFIIRRVRRRRSAPEDH